MATKQTKTPEQNKTAKTESKAASPKTEAAKPAAKAAELKADPAEARARLAATGRNDACPCGSGKKYKKCHLPADEQAAAPAPEAPDAQALLTEGWRLFEQRRPGAAEKEFRAALELDAKLDDAHVGIGMARLSAGNADGAKEELGLVLASGEAAAEKMKADGVKDAFSKTEAQPFIRAAHALGCLAYDEERYEDAVKDLARVHAIDEGNVGVEARLIAAKALMKLERPADAAALLEPATKIEEGKVAPSWGWPWRGSLPVTRPRRAPRWPRRWTPTRITARCCSAASAAGWRTWRAPGPARSKRRCSTGRPTATSGPSPPRSSWRPSSTSAPAASRRRRPPRTRPSPRPAPAPNRSYFLAGFAALT